MITGTPPELIDLGDLLIRRWQPRDLVPRFDAITVSFDHLHPWMVWLAEPPALESQRAFTRSVVQSWPNADGDYNYGIFASAGTVLGAIGLHTHPDVLEIGYWCHVDHTGKGIVTRAVVALAAIARTLVDRVEIHCDEANLASSAVARRAGFSLDRIEDRTSGAPADSGRGCVWTSRST
mgnify:CR=1 FL=1